MPFDEMLEAWRERSLTGNIELRSNFVTSFQLTEKLVQLIERTVQITSPQLTATIEALLNLIQNKETLHEHLKHIIFGMPHEELWRAVDTMYLRCGFG
jgi:DNA topoisomerase IA